MLTVIQAKDLLRVLKVAFRPTFVVLQQYRARLERRVGMKVELSEIAARDSNEVNLPTSRAHVARAICKPALAAKDIFAASAWLRTTRALNVQALLDGVAIGHQNAPLQIQHARFAKRMQYYASAGIVHSSAKKLEQDH